MARFNKVVLIGRLTREPEFRTFSTGGKVAKIGFAVTNRRKNSQTGQWEDEPMFIDCEAFNRGEFGKLADRIERFCHKGSQILIEGRLHLDQWDDKTTGAKRTKHKIVIDEIELLDGKPEGAAGGGSGYQGGGAARTASSAGGDYQGGGFSDHHEDQGSSSPPSAPSGGSDDIPF